MRGLLATAYAYASSLFARLARRDLRRSQRNTARAQHCHRRASELDPTTAPKPTPGDQPHE